MSTLMLGHWDANKATSSSVILPHSSSRRVVRVGQLKAIFLKQSLLSLAQSGKMTRSGSFSKNSCRVSTVSWRWRQIILQMASMTFPGTSPKDSTSVMWLDIILMHMFCRVGISLISSARTAPLAWLLRCFLLCPMRRFSTAATQTPHWGWVGSMSDIKMLRGSWRPHEIHMSAGLLSSSASLSGSESAPFFPFFPFPLDCFLSFVGFPFTLARAFAFLMSSSLSESFKSDPESFSFSSSTSSFFLLFLPPLTLLPFALASVFPFSGAGAGAGASTSASSCWRMRWKYLSLMSRAEMPFSSRNEVSALRGPLTRDFTGRASSPTASPGFSFLLSWRSLGVARLLPPFLTGIPFFAAIAASPSLTPSPFPPSLSSAHGSSFLISSTSSFSLVVGGGGGAYSIPCLPASSGSLSGSAGFRSPYTMSSSFGTFPSGPSLSSSLSLPSFSTRFSVILLAAAPRGFPAAGVRREILAPGLGFRAASNSFSLSLSSFPFSS
eukprot:comp21291_c0_seq1/m.29073 comp21291_c0_seq1/g.29073  ORF comp21291_c0_seq1/g.29073 comp21291_c0_seq1/m.29073 type:complete len:495 (+) comp21291_c0_seq1:800-2284(+)